MNSAKDKENKEQQEAKEKLFLELCNSPLIFCDPESDLGREIKKIIYEKI